MATPANFKCLQLSTCLAIEFKTPFSINQKLRKDMVIKISTFAEDEGLYLHMYVCKCSSQSIQNSRNEETQGIIRQV